MGIDRQRIVDTFYPPGSSVATHFTPCDIPGGCTGDAVVRVRRRRGQGPPGRGRLPGRLHDEAPPAGPAAWLHRRSGRCRDGHPGPAQDQPQHHRRDRRPGRHAPTSPRRAAASWTACSSSAGVRTIPTSPTSSTCSSASEPTKASARSSTTSPQPLKEGGQTADQAARDAAYTIANNNIKTHVPLVPIAHGGSATVFRADVEGAHSSPLGNEALFAMKAGDRNQIVWLQGGEPGGLYCADETDGEALRVCEQIMEPLYSYEIGGTAPEPLLADRVRGERRLDRVDLHPPRRCRVPQRRDLRRRRRRDLVRRPVGRQAPAPCRTGRPVRVLGLPVRWEPEPAATRSLTSIRGSFDEGAPRRGVPSFVTRTRGRAQLTR